jgi:hypothetical protein
LSQIQVFQKGKAAYMKTSTVPGKQLSQQDLEVMKRCEEALQKHLKYCRENDWAGYDPYDALNSGLFKSLPILDHRIPRLVMTQVLKRSPINFRALMMMPKTQNPKALALFLTSFLKLTTAQLPDREQLIEYMIERLIELRSPGEKYWCWGYSFPWQGRSILVPRGAANLICTLFVANALLDAYEKRQDSRCLAMAVSAAEYILNVLYWTEGDSVGYCYPLPGVRGHVHNANFLAAALFCRIYKHTGEEKFVAPALKATRYSVARQEANGSWMYGEDKTQQWVDNFHTGYNLSGLLSISRDLKTTEFDSSIRRGFEFYRSNFFLKDGAVKYFHDRTYPLDTHCVSQSMITLVEFKDFHPDNISLACSVFRWCMDHMWSEKGFFYYRVLPFYTIRTSYMRWTQVWMFFAMATLLSESGVGVQEGSPALASPVSVERR